MHRWTSEDVDILLYCSSPYFEKGLSLTPGVRLAALMTPPLPQYWGYRHASDHTQLFTYMSAGVSNSGPQARVASTLTHEALSPIPTSMISRKQILKSSEFIYFSMLSIDFSLFYSLDVI